MANWNIKNMADNELREVHKEFLEQEDRRGHELFDSACGPLEVEESTCVRNDIFEFEGDMPTCQFELLMNRIQAEVFNFGSDRLHVELMVNVSHARHM